MAVRLSKGQKVDLTKTNPNLKEIIVGLGWAPNASASSYNYDLDASAFLIGSDGKVRDENDFVFYNNPTGGQGSVKHSGDHKKGSGEGDDEQIRINLAAVPGHIQRISFTITINDAQMKRQSFGDIKNSFVRITDAGSGDLLLKYELGEKFSVETAIVAAEIYRHQGEWKFNAIGSGFEGGLAALCRNFGLEVEEDQRSTAPGYGGYQNTQNPYGQNAPSYGQNTSSYGQSTSSYGQSASSYGQNVPAYGSNTPSYGQNNSSYYGQTQSMDSHGGITCPRCHSNQVTAGKKGFGIGKAAIGGILLGPVGVLAGFIGSKNMEFACMSCRERWGSGSNRNTAEWLQRQTENARNVVNKYMGKDLTEALVAGSALVTVADGIIDPAEREKLINYFRTSQEMRGININDVDARFNYYIDKLQRDQMLGKAEALREIGKLASKPEAARLVVRLCCAIGFADGEFAPVEKRVVEEICREVRLDPREFVY
ncbi:putative stress response protein, TerZ- and CABP1 [Desulfosporosinus orientis DSM 765]|uniref:Putative stress response protein, TerZ-and CABP1 n=1 Tax=Desulfosporosinus orientis (strain ATCC 19365 / DSM 765 / NCIMB 8382 / VKM B-1628 / Singapore I) TaxID=768706 RepID=G7W613_DESOD|nr:TerD family protein [Desulfosporosinus orientis]AET67389.1 putative stress response protein, TerZ- and CABP1 [Desulfosporosinus orientis DSM 765]